MKNKLLLIIAFVALVAGSKAQTNVYHPFPDTNTVWRVNGSYWDCNPLCDLYQYTTSGDTLINTNTYTKIYESGIYWLSFWDSIYRGGLRNDTLNRRVYFIDKDSTTERLLYDFSLTIGDTVYNIMPGLSAGYGIITATDSVLVGSNYHKTFLINGGMLYFIEGVGSMQGLLETYFYQFEAAYQLVCFSHNTSVYPNTFPACSLITQAQLTITEPTKPKEEIFTISPNPLTTTATITLPTFNTQQSATIKITDVMGKLILKSEIRNPKTEIDMSNCESGIYFIQLITNNQAPVTKKIVVQ